MSWKCMPRVGARRKLQKQLSALCMVLGEHSGRYAHVGQAFTDAGLALLAFDLRGHGKSGGQRGHFPSLDALMDDIHRHIRQAGEKFSGLPVFLYGHSLGGLLVLNYATYHKHSLTGVIATGAGLRSPVLEQKAKMALSKILGGLLPTVTIPTGLDANGISRDPEVVRAYKEDPLVHGVATLSGARVGIGAVDRVFAHAAEFPAPLVDYARHCRHDYISPWQPGICCFGSRAMYVRNSGMDFITKSIMNLSRRKFLTFMIDWMNTQLKNK